MTTISLLAKQDHLAKVATTRDPVKALSEFVWNAVDADAKNVSIEFATNALDGIEAIRIVDDGLGISRRRVETAFGQLGDSWKKDAGPTPGLGRAMHGKEGRGRLRFFSLAQRAVWTTRHRDPDGVVRGLTIAIEASALDRCDIEGGPTAATTGTEVELRGLKETFDWLRNDEAFGQLSVQFASYLLQYRNATIVFNGRTLDPRVNIARDYDLPSIAVQTTGRLVEDLTIKVIEWVSRNDGRRIYFGTQGGIVLGSLPAHVTAPGFEFSAYASSSLFRELHDANLLELDDLGDPTFLQVLDNVRERLSDHFRSRQAERSSGLIEDLKLRGAYPYEHDPRDDVERRERQVFDIATYAVSSYSREFSRADATMQKMALTMLREAVRHNPESISTILKAVVGLPKNRQDEFSSLLGRAELGNIISASSLIADRIVALETLRAMVFEPKHVRSVKERGELDAIVRDNTWIFGENFHITLPEAGLTRVMARVAEELGKGGGNAKVRQPDGRSGRLDAFMGRAVPHADGDHREFLVVELKRPSVAAGRKEVAQLEDYVRTIKAQPDYTGTSTSWTFILITGTCSSDVENRIVQPDRPRGLIDNAPTAKVWVRTWSEVIREAEGRLRFVQDKLKVAVDRDEIDERIAWMRASILKERPSGADGESADRPEDARRGTGSPTDSRAQRDVNA